VERQLEIGLGRNVTSEDDLEVAYYDYVVPMSASELKRFEPFGLTEIPVKHNVWFRFDDDGLYYVGIWRWEDLP
jgi:hypothetical protein